MKFLFSSAKFANTLAYTSSRFQEGVGQEGKVAALTIGSCSGCNKKRARRLATELPVATKI